MIATNMTHLRSGVVRIRRPTFPFHTWFVMTLQKPNSVQVTAPSYRGNTFREIVPRVRRFYRKYGFLTTIRRSFTVLFQRDEYKRQVALHSGKGNEVVFSKIYEGNLWVDGESRIDALATRGMR
jgi:hypothetical protein